MTPEQIIRGVILDHDENSATSDIAAEIITALDHNGTPISNRQYLTDLEARARRNDEGVEVVVQPVLEPTGPLPIDPDDPCTIIAEHYRRWHHLTPSTWTVELIDRLSEMGYTITRRTDHTVTATVIGTSSNFRNSDGTFGLRLTYNHDHERPLPDHDQTVTVTWNNTPPPDDLTIVRRYIDQLVAVYGGAENPGGGAPGIDTVRHALERLEANR